MENDQHTNAPFQAIFDHTTEGILVVDELGQILLVNPAVKTLFGYEQEELVGERVEILIPEKVRTAHMQHRTDYHKNPRKRSMGQGLELLVKRKDNSTFPVEISLSPYQIGDKTFVIAFIIDTTIRQQLAKAREEMSVALEQEKVVGELKSRFVSIASHEFRTPLSTILSSASLIGSYTDRGDLDGIRRHVGRIKNSIKILQDVLNEFLSLSKLEDGKITTNMEDIPIAVLVKEIQEDIHLLMKDGQQLSCNHRGEEWVRLDKNLLRAVVVNLLTNAIKFSPENSTIQVDCTVENGSFDLVFKDQGMGIPIEDQPKLFERFFRASNANQTQGTGLGLYIVKRYVEIMGGTISMKSTVGEGTEFWIRF